MKRLVFLAANQQEAETLLPICQAIRHKSQLGAEFCLLDGFFKQDVNGFLEHHAETGPSVNPKRVLSKPFYLLPAVQRAIVVLENADKIRALSENYCGVLCGSDGAIQRIFIRKIQSRSGKAYLVNYGLLFDEHDSFLTRFTRKAMLSVGLGHLFYSHVGQGGCDLIFVMGRCAKEVIVRRGISADRVIETGSPRFSPLFRGKETSKQSPLHISHPVSVLYLGAAYDWHRKQQSNEQQMNNLILLDRLAASYPGTIRVSLRMHPRSSEREKGRLCRLQHIQVLPADRPLQDELIDHDLVIAEISTGLVEAIALGKIVARVDFAAGADTAVGSSLGLLPVFQTPVEFLQFAERLGSDSTFARQERSEQANMLPFFFASSTGWAADAIAECVIRTLLDEGKPAE